MPTLVASANLWFSSRHDRWMLPRELLSSQCFPVDASMSFGVACCSFATRAKTSTRTTHDGADDDVAHLNDADPSRRAMCSMAGNSMNTSAVGLAILYCPTQIQIDASLLQIIHARRQQCGIYKRRVISCKKPVQGAQP